MVTIPAPSAPEFAELGPGNILQACGHAVALQTAEQSAEAAELWGRIAVVAPPPGADFADLAAVMEQLDLVAAIDTAAAHLAGALGRPCWLLLPWLNSDWRWMRDRDDSPWYGATRLFRQPSHGD